MQLEEDPSSKANDDGVISMTYKNCLKNCPPQVNRRVPKVGEQIFKTRPKNGQSAQERVLDRTPSS